MDIQSCWLTEFNPKTVDDMVLDQNIKDMFNNFIEKQTITNMTLAGRAGIGKTTIANIIANSIKDSVVLYINASDENGIDTVRVKISNFVESASMGLKIVILDEADGLTKEGQKCLRYVMENNIEDTRFILTCNFPENLIEPIISRCPVVALTFQPTDVFRYALGLIKRKGFNFIADKESIAAIVKSKYPDIRQTITKLENSYTTGKFVNHIDVMNVDTLIDDIKSKTKEDIMVARQYWMDNQNKFGNDYTKLAGLVFNSVSDVKLLERLATKYYQLNMVVDKEIGFFSMMLEFRK